MAITVGAHPTGRSPSTGLGRTRRMPSAQSIARNRAAPRSSGGAVREAYTSGAMRKMASNAAEMMKSTMAVSRSSAGESLRG